MKSRHADQDQEQSHLPTLRLIAIVRTKNRKAQISRQEKSCCQSVGWFHSDHRPFEKPGKRPFKGGKSEKPVPTSSPGKNLNRESSLPPLSLLMEDQVIRLDESTINQTASILEKTLMDFGIPAKVIGYRMGPTVTQFAVEPGYIEKPAPEGQTLKQKVRVSQISQLSKDLALALILHFHPDRSACSRKILCWYRDPQRSFGRRSNEIAPGKREIQQIELSLGGCAWEGCFRSAGCGGSLQDAAFIDCRNYRFRKISLHHIHCCLPCLE